MDRYLSFSCPQYSCYPFLCLGRWNIKGLIVCDDLPIICIKLRLLFIPMEWLCDNRQSNPDAFLNLLYFCYYITAHKGLLPLERFAARKAARFSQAMDIPGGHCR
jgi:hypothetical protein